jgi:hypothetical protein
VLDDSDDDEILDGEQTGAPSPAPVPSSQGGKAKMGEPTRVSKRERKPPQPIATPSAPAAADAAMPTDEGSKNSNKRGRGKGGQKMAYNKRTKTKLESQFTSPSLDITGEDTVQIPSIKGALYHPH